MTVVVSNASPLINLASVGRFDLLAAFYGEILIPDTVYEEVVVRGAGRADARDVREADWITVRRPLNALAVRALSVELGAGEAAAIVLAQEANASLLLMDEIRGRRIAQQLVLPVRGTPGILARARRERQIASLKEVLDLLRARGTWIEQGLYDEMLRLVGETT